MREIDTLDRALFDRFRLELIDAGFLSDDGGRTWSGPIVEPLRRYTTSERMTIEVRDGWPYLQPQLQVPGMQPLEHVNEGGTMCLWPEADYSQAWTTLDGLRERIAEWCARQESGFELADTIMDADAYFTARDRGRLATMGLSSVSPVADGDAGKAYGRWRNDEAHLEITTERGGGGVEGLWFYRERLTAPLTTRDEFREQLTQSQRGRLDRLVGEVQRDRERRRRVAILISGEGASRNALILLLQRAPSGSEVMVRAIEFAPTDLETLRLRAGEDAARLEDRSAIIFGAGAVGSHAALHLAECGLGRLALVDRDRVRPGNVVRHVAPASAVGLLKVEAVTAVIDGHAPWTDVKQHPQAPWGPERLRELTGDHDVVIDATGNLSFAVQLSRLMAEGNKVFVTAALYRRGRVARVCRQGPGDTLLTGRDDEERYPTIPTGGEEEVQLEPGCSAPVNEASPRAVVGCAALATEVVIDALSETVDLPDEIVEIFRPLETTPFDHVGRISSG